MRRGRILAAAAVAAAGGGGGVALAAAPAAALVPGLGPTYDLGDAIEISATGVRSVRTQLPYAYRQLPLCQPASGGRRGAADTLGEILLGESVERSPFQARMLSPNECEVLCTIRLTPDARRSLARLVGDDYRVFYSADGLPAVSAVPAPAAAGEEDKLAVGNFDGPRGTSDRTVRALGVPLGKKDADGVYIYNHFQLAFKYAEPEDPLFGGSAFFLPVALPHSLKIVGFEVVPRSLSAARSCQEAVFLANEQNRAAPLIPLDELTELTFFFGVRFDRVNATEATRWETFLKAQQLGYSPRIADEIHWFAIANSLAIVAVLSALVALILSRTLRRDIARYNDLVDADNELSETGWKLVHGDVFRKPRHSTVLVALVGSGAQLLLTILGTLLVGAIGVGLNPEKGIGSARLLTGGLCSWALMGFVGGYIAARFYKLFQSPNWKMTTIRTATIYPGVVFVAFITVNCFLRYAGSSAAVPFRGIILLTLLWLGLALPLTFLGAYWGFRQPALALPVRVNRIPRQIPPSPWRANRLLLAAVGGALPFGTMFTELVFVFSSMWQHRTYLLFGLLLLVLLLDIVACAEVGIAVTYFRLTNEDYNWWWSAFYVPAASGVYVFIYALLNAIFKLSLSGFASFAVYVGYSAILAFSCFMITGVVGLVSSFIFARAIYSSIRVD